MVGEMRKLYSGGRITYIIDRTGIIRFIQKGVPDNAKILKEIEKLMR
jgi:peroxiredoxin Q/BCP